MRLSKLRTALMSCVFIAPAAIDAWCQEFSIRDNGTVGSPAGQIVGDLGHLSVPESYAHPKGNQITLAFLRFKGVGSRRGPPIFYLAGGRADRALLTREGSG